MTTPRLTKEECRHFIEQQLFNAQDISKENALSESVGRVGIELEVFPYRRSVGNRQRPHPVPLFGGGNSVMEALVKASAPHGGVPKYWHPGSQDTGFTTKIESIGFPDGDHFFFEPGGQVEISTAPCTSIQKLQQQIAGKQEILDLATQQSDIQFAQFGTNPWWGSDDVTNQLHSPRYLAMEHYFNAIGPYGKQMMLLTCSLHINLDLGSSSGTRTKRIIAANLLAPFATAIFANSSLSAGSANGHRSYRNYLWQHLDPARTGILSIDRLSVNYSEPALIDLYLDFAMKAPLIYVREFGEKVLPPHITFEQWMKHPIDGLSPTMPHFINHLSLLFPEVRLKNYLEIRSVDVPPGKWQLVPVMFYTGLLYNDRQLDTMLELLLPLATQMKDLYIRSTLGFESDDIFDTSRQLMRLAIDGCSGLPATFKEECHIQGLTDFFEHFTLRRRTFADEQLDALNGSALLSEQ